MTLEELESIALANNPTVVQAAMRVWAARAKCYQVGLKPNPTIAYAGDEMGDEGRGGMQGAKIGQEIVTGGKLQARMATASREVEQAEQAFQAQRYRVLERRAGRVVRRLGRAAGGRNERTTRRDRQPRREGGRGAAVGQGGQPHRRLAGEDRGRLGQAATQ